VLLLFVFGLNANSLFNQYAYDDLVVMTENGLVEKGIKGIPELLTTEYFNGFSGKKGTLTSARYRPVALITFALEYEFFGENPFVSHLINIILFAILVTLLFRLLHRHLFKNQNRFLAFVTCLIFVVHPIHTEVIANVKGRDEIIAFVLLISSLILFICQVGKKSLLVLMGSLFFFFIALFTKETAVVYIAIIPFILFFFCNQPVKKIIVFTVPYMLVCAVYMWIRYQMVGFDFTPVKDIGNSPYLFATPSQAFATKVFIIFKYWGLLLFPYPLSYDYGYNQIPYLELTDVKFILSIFFILILTGIFLYLFKRKSIYSFCIVYYFITISLATNIFVDLGTILAERMLFLPSLAICIAGAGLFTDLKEKWKGATVTLFVLVLTAYSIKTVARNRIWKNNESLFLTDVNVVPNSLRANQNARRIYIQKTMTDTSIEKKIIYLKRAIKYDEQSLKVSPDNQVSNIDLATDYVELLDCYGTGGLFLKSYQLTTDAPETKKWMEYLSQLLYKKGNGLSEEGQVEEAIKYYRKSVEIDYDNVEAWYNLGENYFFRNDTAKANQAWAIVHKLSPHHVFKKEKN
jgi:tetratricopeptide (TPR) repeat protein